VSRKVGNAVARNRVKRTVREWFRTTRGEMRERIDLVVSARRAAAGLPSLELTAALDRVAQRGGCWK
jgi:ribonuclease P protein component